MIYNRMELDVLQASELGEAMELAFKHKFPALVIHPGLAGDAIRMRGSIRGQFKLLTPVDWKNENVGTVKFRSLSTDALDTDGFEIMLSPPRHETEARAEARALSEFVRNHLSNVAEVRFVLGSSLRTPEEVALLCRGLVGIPNPAMIRLDTQLKLQVSKANVATHNQWLTTVREVIQAPLKICGNITSVRCLTGTTAAARCAVSLHQARQIIKEFESQPTAALRDLLDAPANHVS